MTKTEYQLEENPTGRRWVAVSYPSSKEEAEKLYRSHVKDYPEISFRIVEIKTSVRIVK